MLKPKVSTVVTTKNSAVTLNSLLKSLKNQSYKNIEIIIVDNSSNDKTLEISRKYTRKVFQKGPERSAQRNFGAAQSTGNYLLFLDSDMVLEKDVIKECLNLSLKNNEKPGEIIIPEQSFGKGFWAKTKALEREINKSQSYFEAARFIPKEIFDKMGGFDESLTGPEDWELPQRIAQLYPVYRIKDKIYHNEGNLSLLTLFRKKYYYGLSVDKYLKKRKIPIISPTTVYFLRVAFYKNWRLLLKNPFISLGMILMLLVEMIAGGSGFLVGKIKNAR